MTDNTLVKNEKIDIDAKFKEIDTKFSGIETLFGEFNDQLRTRFAVLDKVCKRVIGAEEETIEEEILT